MKNKVFELAKIGCPDEDICVLLDITHEELHDKYEKNLTLGRATLNKEIRERQVAEAMTGDKTMLTWLGKNVLNQAEKTEQVVKTDKSFADDIDTEKLEKLLEDMEK